MTAIYQSPFLIALGWTIAASLWQSALLWMIYQLICSIYRKIQPSVKHLIAALSLFASFTWFGITLIQKYNEVIQLKELLFVMPQTVTRSPETLLFIASESFPKTMLTELVNGFLPYLSASYLLVLFFLSIKLIKAYLYSNKLKTKGLTEPDQYWSELVDKYARYIGITRKVRIYFSQYIDVPATLDYLKPVILLPFTAFNHLTAQQVESILLHELAHIKRNDYVINIIASIIETILFFNPFVRLLGKSLKKEREHCCDDFVLQHRFDPHSYASALLSLEQMRVGIQPLAIAATGNSNQLLLRIKRIMKVKTREFNYGQKLSAFILLILVMSSIAWLSPASKHITKQQQKKSSITSVVTTQNTNSASSLNQEKLNTLLKKDKSVLHIQETKISSVKEHTDSYQGTEIPDMAEMGEEHFPPPPPVPAPLPPIPPVPANEPFENALSLAQQPFSNENFNFQNDPALEYADQDIYNQQDIEENEIEYELKDKALLNNFLMLLDRSQSKNADLLLKKIGTKLRNQDDLRKLIPIAEKNIELVKQIKLQNQLKFYTDENIKQVNEKISDLQKSIFTDQKKVFQYLFSRKISAAKNIVPDQQAKINALQKKAVRAAEKSVRTQLNEHEKKQETINLGNSNTDTYFIPEIKVKEFTGLNTSENWPNNMAITIQGDNRIASEEDFSDAGSTISGKASHNNTQQTQQVSKLTITTAKGKTVVIKID